MVTILNNRLLIFSLSFIPVDDHFAKALGETWVKLQAESKAKESSAERSEVSSPCSNTSILQQRRGLVST